MELSEKHLWYLTDIMELIFATNNQHKVTEVQSLLPAYLNVKSLRQAGINVDIPEPHPSLEENAAEKARTIFNLTGLNCFSEDTGLEVAALNNEPGVKSARYAGEPGSSQKNIEKLLAALQGKADRSARFRTVICLVWEEKEYYFEGVCKGHITTNATGAAGFGYDPVFVPEGAGVSFADMSLEEKNKWSHRAKALQLLVTFLNQFNPNK